MPYAGETDGPCGASMARVSTEKINRDLGPLTDRLATIGDLNCAASVLAWDRQTYMPEGGVRSRAEQLASLARVAHEMLVSPETGELLERAGERELESDAGALLRLAQGASTTGPSGCRLVWWRRPRARPRWPSRRGSRPAKRRTGLCSPRTLSKY
jgi:hypothetical protein